MFAYSRAMSRARTIPDEAIHARLRVLLAEGGEKAVSFASVPEVVKKTFASSIPDSCDICSASAIIGDIRYSVDE